MTTDAWQNPVLPLPADALGELMPMHVATDLAGTITHVGPTMAKINPGRRLVGARFCDVFEVRRMGQKRDLVEICRNAGRKFYLRLGDPDRTPLIGTAVEFAAGEGVLVNLSFGIAVVDAVARFDLAGSDFAATDLTLEMLYLVEAKSAAMDESRQLNQRLHGAKAEAEAEALSDTLTGLRNRRALDARLARMIARGTPFTLMQLDLDFFKQVNDTLGHDAGDLVLTEVARILCDETREEDVVARVGGDEFVLLFPHITDSARMAAIAERLIARLEEPVPYGDETAQISASLGLTLSTDYDPPEAARMMLDADAALYASKQRGRACYSFSSPTPAGAVPGPLVAGLAAGGRKAGDPGPSTCG